MVQASMVQKDFSICMTAGLATLVNNCGKSPSAKMSVITGSTVKRSAIVKSGQQFHFSGNGPLKTRCKMVSKKMAVSSRPGMESRAVFDAKRNEPLKMRNSPGKPVSPGKTRQEK